MTSKNRKKPSAALDPYYTPDWLVRLTLERVVPRIAPVPSHIIEPGAGGGAFVKQLRARYPDSHITAIDVVANEWPEATESIVGDFLTAELGRYDLAVGNPPFSLAMPFIQRCRAVSKATVLLLRQGFLSSARRAAFWRLHPPNDVFILPDRPSFTPDRQGDSADYCLVCWGKQALGLGFPQRDITRLHWLPTVPLAERKCSGD